MSTVSVPRGGSFDPDLPRLENGDRMKQAEFHRLYETYPEDVKFELIGGTVYMASPLRRRHGTYHSKLNYALAEYEAGTPGVELLDNATTILGDESEPQPDSALRILPEWGGQTKTNDDDYVVGPPELVAEVAYSSQAIDLHQKREDYQRAGVLEYLVLLLKEKEIRWFSFKTGDVLEPNRKGVYRSEVYPGLWIDGLALLARNSRQLIKVVKQGLASREHAAFVKRLKAAHKKHRSK